MRKYRKMRSMLLVSVTRPIKQTTVTDSAQELLPRSPLLLKFIPCTEKSLSSFAFDTSNRCICVNTIHGDICCFTSASPQK